MSEKERKKSTNKNNFIGRKKSVRLSVSLQSSRLSQSDLALLRRGSTKSLGTTPTPRRRKSHGRRISRVLSEMHDYGFRERDELIQSIKAQARELAVFFSLFVLYVLFGAVVFFYIEECSGASLAKDGSTPSLVDEIVEVSIREPIKTCQDIYFTVVNVTSLNVLNAASWNSSLFAFLPSCQTILNNAVEPYVKTKAYKTECEVNEFQLLKYAEYTIFTLLTVGYGNTTPVTIIGRYVLIIYAICGVPIAVSMYSVAGKLLVQIFTFTVQWFEKRVLKRKGNIKNQQAKILVMSCVVMLLIMLLGCSVTMRSDMEGWTFSTSIYFWFVSLTTIGYGDLHFQRNKHLESIHFLMLSAGNLLFGLGISAAIIEAFAMALEQREQLINEDSDDEEEDEGGDDERVASRAELEDETQCDGSLSEQTQRRNNVRFQVNEAFENDEYRPPNSPNNNWLLHHEDSPTVKPVDGEKPLRKSIIKKPSVVMQDYEEDEDDEIGRSVSSGDSINTERQYYHDTNQS